MHMDTMELHGNFVSVTSAGQLLFGVVILPLLVAIWYLYQSGIGAAPGPRGWPLLGVVTGLDQGRYHLNFEAWAKRYGPVMSLRLGPKLVYVLSDGASAYEALVKNADDFAERRPLPMGQHLFDTRGSVLFQNWKNLKDSRRFFLSAFRKLGVGKSSLESQIKEESSFLLNEISSFNGEAFDPAPCVNLAITNVISYIALGKRFDYADPAFVDHLKRTQTSIKDFPVICYANFLPFLFYTPLYDTNRRTMAETRAFFRQIIQEHRMTLDPNNMRDVIDMYLSEVGKHGGTFSDVFLERAISDLFGAGSDTSSNTILWSLLILTKHPDVQAKVQQEIDDVIGNGRTPSMEDKSKMPYTNATIMEVMRFMPVVPLIYRHTTKDTKMNGHTIRKGTQVFVNIWAVMRDGAVYENPDLFQPERFFKGGESAAKNEAFIPFGAGRRVCLGENLAKMELFLIFTTLFQKFRFTAPNDEPEKLKVEGVFGLTNTPFPFEICAHER